MIYFFIFIFSDVTLKSILCQSETLVLKKLLCIAVTVRQFVGNWMNLSALFTHFNEGSCFFLFLFFSCPFEGLKHIHAITQASPPGETEPLSLSLKHLQKSEAFFKITRKMGMKEYLQSFTVCVLRACEAL